MQQFCIFPTAPALHALHCTADCSIFLHYTAVQVAVVLVHMYSEWVDGGNFGEIDSFYIENTAFGRLAAYPNLFAAPEYARSFSFFASLPARSACCASWRALDLPEKLGFENFLSRRSP